MLFLSFSDCDVTVHQKCKSGLRETCTKDRKGSNTNTNLSTSSSTPTGSTGGAYMPTSPTTGSSKSSLVGGASGQSAAMPSTNPISIAQNRITSRDSFGSIGKLTLL